MFLICSFRAKRVKRRGGRPNESVKTLKDIERFFDPSDRPSWPETTASRSRGFILEVLAGCNARRALLLYFRATSAAERLSRTGVARVRRHEAARFLRRHLDRRRGVEEFGPSELSGWSERVDLLGRSLPYTVGQDAVAVWQDYLGKPLTRTARLLAKKAVVILEPAELRGQIIWPTTTNTYAS
jgi:hypothetical protein